MSTPKLILTICTIMLSLLGMGQSVVVSNYYNATDQRDEWIELLVTGDDVDITNWSIRDNNSAQTSWQPEVYFSSDPLWTHLRRGTIIVLWNRVVASDGLTMHASDVNKDDGYIEINVQNSTYFTGGDFYAGPTYLGPTLNIAATGDIIQLRDSSGNHIHCLGHKFTVGASFIALPSPKINLSSGISNGEATIICPGGSLADYGTNSPQSGTTYADGNIFVDFGLPNACAASSTTNRDFWNDLREPDFSNQLVTPFPIIAGNPGSATFNWVACSDVYSADIVTGYIILRNTTNTFSAPVDGTTYLDGQTLGGATILAHIPSSQITTYTDNTVMDGIEYYYRVYAYRYSTDQPNGNSYHVSRGRAYTDTFVSVETLLLPVSLGGFNATLQNGKTILYWHTLHELNNDFFTLEKSRDGNTFIPLADVEGNGTTFIPFNYSYTDDSPYTGVNYYRLSQTDWNGDQEYLGVRQVYNLVPTVTLTYVGKDYYQIDGTTNSVVRCELIDQLGRIIERTTITSIDGRGLVQISSPNGYLIVIYDGEHRSVHRLYQ